MLLTKTRETTKDHDQSHGFIVARRHARNRTASYTNSPRTTGRRCIRARDLGL